VKEEGSGEAVQDGVLEMGLIGLWLYGCVRQWQGNEAIWKVWGRDNFYFNPHTAQTLVPQRQPRWGTAGLRQIRLCMY
jgi:hypothetical protein